MAGPLNESSASDFRTACERVYREWHERAKALDTDGLLALYSADAVLESPLVPAILDDKRDGILRGHDELRRFFAEGGRWRPNDLVRWYRTGEWLMVTASWFGSTRGRHQMVTRWTLLNLWRSSAE
jgi:hypothetical protein